jgi:hypothetical protein
MFCENFEPNAVKITIECEALPVRGGNARTIQRADGPTTPGVSEHPEPASDDGDKV